MRRRRCHRGRGWQPLSQRGNSGTWGKGRCTVASVFLSCHQGHQQGIGARDRLYTMSPWGIGSSQAQSLHPSVKSCRWGRHAEPLCQVDRSGPQGMCPSTAG
jgi:hypothetical protein